MSWNVQGSMRGDGVPVAPGMLDGEVVAAGIMKAEGAILGLFQETGLQDPPGVVHSENQWSHHGYDAYPGVDAQAASAAAVRGGLLIAFRADIFAAEEVRDVVDILPGKAMALDVVTAGGTLTVINVLGPGSGDDSWASKASFWADVAMYRAAKSAGGTRAVLLGGDFNVWLESLWHCTTRRFHALWEQCGFRRAGPEREEDRRPTRAGHRRDSFLLNRLWSLGRRVSAHTWRRGGLQRRWRRIMALWSRTSRWRWPAKEGSPVWPTRTPKAGCMPYARTPRGFVRRRRQYCRRPAGIRGCRRGYQRTRTLPPWARQRCRRSLTCSTPSRVDVSRVTGVGMPSGMDQQYLYGQAETEGTLAQVLSDQQALAWRAHELWQRDAAAAGLHSQEATALLQHLRRVDPDLSPASVEDLRAALDQQLHQLETRVEELPGVLRSNSRRSIKDYWRGRVPDLQL